MQRLLGEMFLAGEEHEEVAKVAAVESRPPGLGTECPLRS